MARVEQITEKAQLAPQHHALYDRIAQARGRVGGPYSILLHSPEVADKVDQLSGTLRAESGLSAEEFVLVALSVARTRDCAFVWSVQAPAARRAGVSDNVIEAIRTRGTNGLTADQRDIVAFAAQVVGANTVEHALFQRLCDAKGVKWLVGLTTVAGHFALISGINNAFEVPASPGGDTL